VLSEIPLLPKIPENGAKIFSDFNFAIISPFFTSLLNSMGSKSSVFLILKDVVLLGSAVP